MGDIIHFPTPAGPTANDTGVTWRGCSLYRAYSRSSRLLYIGISNNPTRRAKQHAAEKSWWTEVDHLELEWFDTRDQAELAEREAIRGEQPFYNLTRYDGSALRKRRRPHLQDRPSISTCMVRNQPWILVEHWPAGSDVYASLDPTRPLVDRYNRWDDIDPDGVLGVLLERAARRSLHDATYGATGDIAVIQHCDPADADPIGDALLDWWNGGTIAFDLLSTWASTP